MTETDTKFFFEFKKNIDPGLYIISTPIGNKMDITLRSIETLQLANIIVCENIKKTRKLFDILGFNKLSKNWMSYNDHTSEKQTNKIIDLIISKKIVALVSDAGTPIISDPGYKLIRKVLSKNLFVTSLPGPSAITSAITLSGQNIDKFIFLGFLPKNKNSYIGSLRKYSFFKTTLVIFEKADRINFLLKIIREDFRGANLTIVREITKLHEEIINIPYTDIDDFLNRDIKLKGEITILISFKNSAEKKVYTNKEILKELKTLKPSQVSAMLAKKSSESREVIYKRCVNLTKQND